jgi:hypothetical protein
MMNSSKQHIYFKKCMSMFTMHYILPRLYTPFTLRVVTKVLVNRPMVRQSGNSALRERLCVRVFVCVHACVCVWEGVVGVWECRCVGCFMKLSDR